MPIGDQVPRGSDDVVRRLGLAERAAAQALALGGSAKAIAAAIQTGLGNLASSGTLWQGPVASPSTISAVGSITGDTGTFPTGISSTGVYNTLVTTGSFRTVSVNISGQLGETVSSRRFKQDIETAPSMHDGLMAVGPFLFRYINDVELNGDDAIVHLGGMAEDFEAAGLGFLIDYEDDGVTPHGIKYELLALALLPTIQTQQTRLDVLEARLVKAGL